MMMMTRPRTELLLILLLVSRCSPDVVPDLDLVEETLSDLGDLESLGRDFSQIYTGWVNSTCIMCSPGQAMVNYIHLLHWPVYVY